MTEVAYWSLFFLPTVLRYGAHCYLQVGLGLSFSLSWNTRSLAGRGVPVNTPHTKQELAAGATHQRSAVGPGTRGARCRSGGPHSHFATAIPARSVRGGYPINRCASLISSRQRLAYRR